MVLLPEKKEAAIRNKGEQKEKISGNQNVRRYNRNPPDELKSVLQSSSTVTRLFFTLRFFIRLWPHGPA